MEIGKIVNTHGLKGELKVFPYIDYFDDLSIIYINDKKFEIEKCRYQKNVVILKIKGIDNIDEAEKYKNIIIDLKEEDAPELPKGTYYIKDLIGSEVYTDEGKLLGILDDVFNTGANDIYQVGNILLPVIDEVVKEVDIKNKKIIVHIIKGLLDWGLKWKLIF